MTHNPSHHSACICFSPSYVTKLQGFFILGTSEGAGSAASLPGCGVPPKNSFSCFLSVAAGALENEKALTFVAKT
jgi:hypothetical protein